MHVSSRTTIVAVILLAAACETAAPPPAAAPMVEEAARPTGRVAPPFAGLSTSDAVVEMIKADEGLRLEAYRGSSGVWLIGYGHSGDDVTAGMRITVEKADSLLRADLLAIEDQIKGLVTVPINEDELSAMVDLVYNIGSGNFRTSTVLRELNAENRQAAADGFLLWDKITLNGQLVVSAPLAERRQRERAMFLGETSAAGT